MAYPDVRSALSRLLVALGAPSAVSRSGEVEADAELLAICLDVYTSNGSRARSAWSAEVLTQVLRTLISAGAPGAKKVIEACFMELVKRDNGSLPQLLTVVGEIIQSGPLQSLLTSTAAASASLDHSTASSAAGGSVRSRRAPQEERQAAAALDSSVSTTMTMAAPSRERGIVAAAVRSSAAPVATVSRPPPEPVAPPLPDANILVRILREGASPGSGVASGATVEALDRVCYGDRVMLRSRSADGPGFLAVDAATTGRAGSRVTAHTGGSGTGAAVEVFEVQPGDAATRPTSSWRGQPVRCGDAVLLKCMANDRFLTVGGTGGALAAFRAASSASRGVQLNDAPTSSSKWGMLSLSALQHAIAAPSAMRAFIRRADVVVLVAYAGTAPLASSLPSPEDAREAALRMEVLTTAAYTSRVNTADGEGATLRMTGVIVDAAFASPGAGDALAHGLDVSARTRRGDDSSVNDAARLLAAHHSMLSDAAHSSDASGPSAATALLLATIPAACITWSLVCMLPQPLSASPHTFSPAPRIACSAPHALHHDSARISRRKLILEPALALPQLPAVAQESILVEHVLSALYGSGGGLIRTSSPEGDFTLAQVSGRRGPAIDAGLLTLTERLLPVASAAQRCRAFIDTCSTPHCNGRIRQAVAMSLRIVLREFMALLQQLTALHRKPSSTASRARDAALAPPVAWMPASSLTLHQLWFYLQPAARTLADLDVITQRLALAHGGDILTRLCTLASESGSDSIRVLCKLMLEHASAPYLRMLEGWMYAGELNDPHAEFMIADAEHGAAVGERTSSSVPVVDIMSRFTVRDDMTPIFLRPHTAAIQHAGKYLNMLRLCADAAGVTATAAATSASASSASTAAARLWRVSPHACTLRFSVDSEAYTGAVTDAATFASRSVLEYFMLPTSRGGLDMFGRLASLKGFFLLARGDYLNHFLDTASAELAKEVSSAATTTTAPIKGGGNTVLLHRLRGQLELALRSSTAAYDSYAAAVTCALAPSSLLARLDPAGARLTAVTGLKGYNVFELRYAMPWPVSLLFIPASLERYQHVFRHLFFCRYVEKAVADCWVAHQSCKELDMRATLALSFTLRQRMLHFLQNLQYYMHVEVIEPRWHELLDRVAGATNIDDVVAHHSQFLTIILAECLLTSPDLLKLLTKLITLCLLFAEQITNSIENHRLTSAELDRLAGVNKASERARVQLERGEYYDVDAAAEDDDETKSTISRASVSTKRRTSRQLDAAARRAARAVKPTATELRVRRKARLAAQTDAMRHTMAQRGWQAMIEKSSRMFDALLRDFLLALLDRTRVEYTAAAANLCARLDYNGFYSAHLGLIGLDTSGSA